MLESLRLSVQIYQDDPLIRKDPVAFFSPRRLTRVMSRGRAFIPEVDGLRFVAITAVVFYHISGYTAARQMTGAVVSGPARAIQALLGLGYCGVELFFILSGFLLVLPFAKWRFGKGEKPSLR